MTQTAPQSHPTAQRMSFQMSCDKNGNTERPESGRQGLMLCGWGKTKGQTQAEEVAERQTKVGEKSVKF